MTAIDTFSKDNKVTSDFLAGSASSSRGTHAGSASLQSFRSILLVAFVHDPCYNAAVEKLAEKHDQRYIDLNEHLRDSEGRLKAEFTIEGVHMNHDGYRAIFDDLMKYVMED